MSFVLQENANIYGIDFSTALCLAEDICALLYTLHHDMNYVRGVVGYKDTYYTILPRYGDFPRNVPFPIGTVEICFDGYYNVLTGVAKTEGSLLYPSLMRGEYQSCVLCLNGPDNVYRIRNTPDQEAIKGVDMSYENIISLSDWTEEMWFQQSLVMTDWELLGAIIFSTLRDAGFISARIDIGHMLCIIHDASKFRMDEVRKYYSQRSTFDVSNSTIIQK